MMNYLQGSLAILCCTFAAANTFAQSTPALAPEAIQHIDAAAETWRTTTKAPGLSIAIVRDNQLVWSKGYGLADLQNKVPAQSDTVYRLASLTKCLTGVAVMQLVEEGKLDLDAPIQRYVRSYPGKAWPVTARHLLTHMAGVRHNKWSELTSTRRFASIDEAIGVFKEDALLFEPGTKYSYSTPGYVLLGGAIESASGMPYLRYIEERILRPAGMTQTAADDPGATIPKRAIGYRKGLFGFHQLALLRGVHVAPPHDTSIKISAGGLVSTVEDMARFAIALNTGQLLRPDTRAQMWTKPKTRDGKESDYAFGFLVGEKNGGQRVYNDGSQAGTRTFLFIQPNENFAVSLMTNLEKGDCEVLTAKIRDAVLR